MRYFGYRDAAVYFLICFAVMIQEYGFFQFFIFIFGILPFALIQLPYVIFAQRIYCPYPQQSKFSQRATTFEFAAAELMKYHLKYTKSDGIGKVFFSSRVWDLLTRYRLISQGYSEIGDTVHNVFKGSGEFEDVEGIWICSQSRVKQNPSHDVVVYFIHGGGFSMCSSHLYTEYLSILLVNLLQQGFSNPGIYVPEFSFTTESMFPAQLTSIARGYEYLTKTQTGAHIVVAGDSTGGTLALSLLLHISRPFKAVLEDIDEIKEENRLLQSNNNLLTFLTQGNDSNIIGQSTELIDEIQNSMEKQIKSSVPDLKKPSAAILISPIPNLFKKCTKDSENTDYLSTDIISRWRDSYVLYQPEYGPEKDDNEDDAYHSPGLCKDKKWWEESFPEYGIVLSYGADEVLSEDLDEFSSRLKEYGKVKIDRQNSQIHDWALLSFFTERKVEHREASIQFYAGILSRMLLWHTDGYFEPGAKEPNAVVTIDEEHV